MRGAMIVLAISAPGVAVGIFSLDVARYDPDLSFAGAWALGAAALLGAGWALIGGGLAFWAQTPASRTGPLLVAAGFAWFLLEWNNPGAGSALAFTIGLCLYAACPPLVGHAVLAYPGGRLRGRFERGAVAVAYAGSLVLLGVLPALLFDPHAQGCNQCPRNLLLVADRGGLADDLTRAGLYLGLASALTLSVLVLARVVRAWRQGRRAGQLILLAGGAYLGLVASMFAVSLDRGLLSNGTLERRLWLGEAAALAGVVLGVGWSWVRGRRARSRIAQLVVDLARSPPPGGLRDVLAGIVGDPELVLAYPLADSDRLVDATGRPVELSALKERTSLVRDGRDVAVLAHEPGLLGDEQLVDEVTVATRLALENERLQAEVRARLEELGASRARIVAAGDSERKRLERDLHDGAQQRLVGLSLSLRLLRSQRPFEADSLLAARLEEAEAELRTAIAELRELAQGIFPAVLADEGLAAAVEALIEDAGVSIRIRGLPEGRFAAPVETAAYTVVAEAARAATSALVVRGEVSHGWLVVELESGDLGGALDLVGLEDRVGAIDGHLIVDRQANGRVTIRAELPCES